MLMEEDGDKMMMENAGRVCTGPRSAACAESAPAEMREPDACCRSAHAEYARSAAVYGRSAAVYGRSAA
eukprot:123-Rhodomonas_salina.1